MELEKNEQGRGLGLTEYTLYGIQAHTKPEYKPGRMNNPKMLGYYNKYLKQGCMVDGEWAWSLEALLVGQADEIAQWHHDLEDALLEGAELPLPGLSVIDGALTYNGHPWDGMSGAEQLQVATAIVRRLNPECGFVLMDKLEQMDPETLREFGEWLEREGLQVIATRVSTGNECSIIIEEGTVSTPAETAAFQEGVF